MLIGAVGFYFFVSEEDLISSHVQKQEVQHESLESFLDYSKSATSTPQFSGDAVAAIGEKELSIESRQIPENKLGASLLEETRVTSKGAMRQPTNNKGIHSGSRFSAEKNDELLEQNGSRSAGIETQLESNDAHPGERQNSERGAMVILTDDDSSLGLVESFSNERELRQEITSRKLPREHPFAKQSLANTQEAIKTTGSRDEEEPSRSMKFLAPILVNAIDTERSEVMLLQNESRLQYQKRPESKYVSKQSFVPNEMAVSIGLDLLMLDFQNSESALDLNNLSKEIPGYSASILGSWVSHKGVRLSVGLEYARLRSKFDYQVENNILFLDEDRLITYALDESTGDTINAVYQDTWVNAIETRTIIHHNEFSLLSIPISIGYEHDFGKFGLGLDVWINYGFFLNQKGRSINAEGAIAHFDMKNGTDTPFNPTWP